MLKFSKKLQKSYTFLFVILILIALIILASLFRSSNINFNTNSNSSQTDRITFNNVSIPNFDYPINQRKVTDFTSRGDIRTYSGAYQFGIDVSEYQGNIDWAKVKNAGVDFAMIRVGYRGWGSNGKIVLDGAFEQNVKSALENNIEVGIYFFSQATSETEAIQEANFVLEYIGQFKDNISYPVVFDWERVDEDGSRSANPTMNMVSNSANAFCNTIKNAGFSPMIYLNKDMAYNLYDLTAVNSYPIWIAELDVAPSFYYDFDIWQYSHSGTVDGINGKVDLNLSFYE